MGVCVCVCVCVFRAGIWPNNHHSVKSQISFIQQLPQLIKRC